METVTVILFILSAIIMAGASIQFNRASKDYAKAAELLRITANKLKELDNIPVKETARNEVIKDSRAQKSLRNFLDRKNDLDF